MTRVLPPSIETGRAQTIFRVLLGVFMLLAAIGHLTFQREEFNAQVPNWVPLSKDLIVVLFGIVEAILGLLMIFGTRWKVWVGITLAVFFVAIFPGNVSQYMNGIDAFGLDTDQKRFVRLFFQPVLILWALWSTGVLQAMRRARNRGRA